MEQQPTTIGRYCIEQVLDRGGWGAFYRAHDPALSRSAAPTFVPQIIQLNQHKSHTLRRYDVLTISG